MSVSSRVLPMGAVCLAVVLGLLGGWLVLDHDGVGPQAPSGSRADPGQVGSRTDQPTGGPRHRARGYADPSARKGVPDRIAGPALKESQPVALGIPRLGVRSSLVELRLDSSAAMEVPQEPALAGWYGLGPTPGALGPAVIAGHVAWNGTPGVFARLAQLRSGDIVTVSRDDGRTAVFMVTRVIEVSKEHFPTEAVYGPVNHAALRLITCAGDYDEVEHRYADNAVVFARLMDVRGART